jgi:hypothetical protein
MPRTRRWPEPEKVVKKARKGIIDDTLVHASLAELASWELSDALTLGDGNTEGHAPPSGDSAQPRRNGKRKAAAPVAKGRVSASRPPP